MWLNRLLLTSNKFNFSFLIRTFHLGIGFLILLLCANIIKADVNLMEKAVDALIERTLGKNSKYFQVIIDNNLEVNSYNLYSTLDETNATIRIVIEASNGISASKGFHYYLKNYIHYDIYWYNRYIQLPDNFKWPIIAGRIFSKAASDIIYYQNVCTWGYSFVWWNYDQWVRHIDWMAMMGISLTIAPIQEHLWYQTYKELGLNDEDINNYFTGPAFLPWFRMGNMHSWGGPLSSEARISLFILQQRIIQLQRSFGMKVAVPAFSGFVPLAIKRLYSNTTFTVIERWNRFSEKYCCSLFLAPDQQLFVKIANKFQKNVINSYGTDHIYFADPYNEVRPKILNVQYINMVATGIYRGMQNLDKEAIWLLQGWMFIDNLIWSDELIHTFLTSVPLGKLLVLDLQSEQRPQYIRTHSYYGQPFIWCMLHNFGGTLGMHGSVKSVNSGISQAYNMPNSSMIGVGITPEGINQNYVMYALALDRAWSNSDLNLTEWFINYATARYGIENRNLQNAWHLLRDSVYSYRSNRSIHGKYILVRRPSFHLQTWMWYNPLDVYNAWRNLLMANNLIPITHYDNYEHDLVDITRQYLQINAEYLYISILNTYKQKRIDLFNIVANRFMKLFIDLEKILETHVDFLLGKWLNAAENFLPHISNETDRRLYSINARNQITIWGPNGEIIDYATKQWSGLIEDYHAPRWKLFLDDLRICLLSNSSFNYIKFLRKVFTLIEEPFSYQNKSYPSKPKYQQMTFSISKSIFKRWSPINYDFNLKFLLK